MFIKTSLYTLNILFCKVKRGLGHKEKHFVRKNHLHYFFKKMVTDDLN